MTSASPPALAQTPSVATLCTLTSPVCNVSMTRVDSTHEARNFSSVLKSAFNEIAVQVQDCGLTPLERVQTFYESNKSDIATMQFAASPMPYSMHAIHSGLAGGTWRGGEVEGSGTSALGLTSVPSSISAEGDLLGDVWGSSAIPPPPPPQRRAGVGWTAEAGTRSGDLLDRQRGSVASEAEARGAVCRTSCLNHFGWLAWPA